MIVVDRIRASLSTYWQRLDVVHAVKTHAACPVKLRELNLLPMGLLSKQTHSQTACWLQADDAAQLARCVAVPLFHRAQ